jgi:molybdopterin molybdotransferase
MVLLTALHWDKARDAVRRAVAGCSRRDIETVPLATAAGRVLAQTVQADRAYPPFHRSMRDGYAVRTVNLPGRVRVIGEIRAGEPATQRIEDGECIEIMTGAAVPDGSDAILMVEHAERAGDLIDTKRFLNPGDNINPMGSEASAGDNILEPGVRIDYAHIGALATIGAETVSVYKNPRVSIVATGDELVGLNEHPADYQIRNSNSFALAAQINRAGGEVAFQTIAPDNAQALRDAMDRAFESDLVVLSGGVSAGKYDLVESVLAEYGAEFFFTRVRIQPGQPAVFGKACGKFFFGLPGNPASTMVTFELFARLAIELLAGDRSPKLPFSRSRLTANFRHKVGLTRFLPALLTEHGEAVTPVKGMCSPWRGRMHFSWRNLTASIGMPAIRYECLLDEIESRHVISLRCLRRSPHGGYRSEDGKPADGARPRVRTNQSFSAS